MNPKPAEALSRILAVQHCYPAGPECSPWPDKKSGPAAEHDRRPRFAARYRAEVGTCGNDEMLGVCHRGPRGDGLIPYNFFVGMVRFWTCRHPRKRRTS